MRAAVRRVHLPTAGRAITLKESHVAKIEACIRMFARSRIYLMSDVMDWGEMD